MRKYLNILSAAVLMVYGTLTLVIVPMHHHAAEGAENTFRNHSFVSHISGDKHGNILKAKECDVCVFTSLTVVLQASASTGVTSANEIHHSSTVTQPHVFELLSSHPHRGPPNFFA